MYWSLFIIQGSSILTNPLMYAIQPINHLFILINKNYYEC